MDLQKIDCRSLMLQAGFFFEEERDLTLSDLDRDSQSLQTEN